MPPSFGTTDRARASASDSSRGIVSTDGELLYLATKRNDSAALEELFARHADMVWHVCQQVLWREADAEDAFQATFLILLRRAAAIRASDSVAAWLYRVAYRTALAARRRGHKRKTEPLTGEPPAPEVEYPDLESRYITGILLEELSLLPQKYQRALVLRYLEGRSRREIADQTDLTVAAVQGYLARGKQLLRGRLLRRGVLLSTGMAMLTTTQAASAAPAALVATNITLGAAVASGAAGALAKISTPTLQLVDQGARSMFLSTMMAKPVVWVAVAFAAAGVTASQSPGGGAPQEGVVLSAEVAGGEDAGVIQLTAAEAPAEGEGAVLEERPLEKPVMEERPVEKPRVEERRIKKPVELIERRVLEVKERVNANKAVVELQRKRLARQREQFEMQVKALRKQAEALAVAESERAKIEAEAKALQFESEALRAEAEALRIEQELLQLEMPPDVLIPAAWTPAPTPVKVRMQPPGPYSAIEVPAPPEPPSPPAFARKAMERAMEASVRSAVEASKPGMLAAGQTIQVEIYSESASADLPDPSMNPSGEMGMMERPNNSNSTRSLTIEPMGTIAFGAKYGRVKVAGMSLEEAEKAIAEKLREQVPDVKVQITLPNDRPEPGPMTTSP